MALLIRCKIYLASANRKFRRILGMSTDLYPPRQNGSKLSPSLGLIAATDMAPRNSAFDLIRISEWQTAARKRLAEMIGYTRNFSPPKLVSVRGPINSLSGKHNLARSTYYLRIRAETDIPVTFIVAENTNTPLPVFLFLSGSTSGVHLGWGGVKVPIDHHRLSIGADMARQAARRGYLAVCIEQIGYGEREEHDLPKPSPDRTIDIAIHAALLGQSLMGLKAMDVSAVIDWIESSEAPYQIDPERIFLFGHSSGGIAAQYAAALDPRIKGTLASGSVRRISEIVATRGNGNGEILMPGFLNEFESEDVLALVAPRSFVALSGVNDHIFPFEGVERVVENAKPAFAAMDASEKLMAVRAPYGHQYYAEESWTAWKTTIDPQCASDEA